jgi:competence protein ComEC
VAHAARARAWGVFAALAAGVWLSSRLSPHAAPIGAIIGDAPLSALAFGAAGLASASILLLGAAPARAAALVASLALGFAAHHARVNELPRDHLARLLGPAVPGEPAPLLRLEGMALERPIVEAPRPGTLDAMLSRFDGATAGFPLRVDTLHTDAGPIRTRGEIGVYAPIEEIGGVHPGDRLHVLGLHHPTRPAMNPGQPDSLAWANQAGRAGWLRTAGGAVEPLGPRSIRDRVVALALRARASARAAASAVLPNDRSPAADVLGAMLLGDRTDGDRQALFARTGVAHLLAISGFHLAVLVGLAVGLVRLTGDRPRAELLVGLALIGAYLLVVPGRTPIVRAALLAAVVLVARFSGRRWDRLTLLGWIAGLLILARPLDLFTLGFQLTVGVTALLLWLGEGPHPWITGPPARIDQGEPGWPRLALRQARALAAGSVLVWLAAAPVIAFHTGSFNVLTPLAVIATTPIATLAQVLGMGGMLVWWLSPPAASALMLAAEAAAGLLALVSAAFDAPGLHTVLPPVTAAWAAAGVGAVVFALRRARLRDPRPWAAGAGVLVWLGVEIALGAGPGRGVAARIDMLSVGDGSCLLVRSGGDALLWDAGSLVPAQGVTTIPRALRALGAARVPTAVVTHANLDHYAALPDAAPQIGLRRVLVSAPALAVMRGAAPGSPERVFLDRLAERGVEVAPLAAGASVALGPSTLRVLWPPEHPPSVVRTRNDHSLVARVEIPTEAGPRSALLCGDIQRTAMLSILADGAPVRAEVLELPHHGSHHDAAERFVAEVDPLVVLQSTGPSRLGDARWSRAWARVSSRGGAWLVTARDGAAWAVVKTDGSVEPGSFR